MPALMPGAYFLKTVILIHRNGLLQRCVQHTDCEVRWKFKVEERLKACEVLQDKDTVTKHVTRTDTLHWTGSWKILH